MIAEIICLLYIFYAIPHKPESLSATNYMFKYKLFGPYCVLLAFLLLPAWLDAGGGFLSFLACGGLLFVGATANYRESDLVMKVHFIAAYISCISIIVLVLVLNPLCVLVIPIGMLIVALITGIKDTYIFWIEVFVFITNFICLWTQ